ncbi:hypothetical protein POUND7_000149, partial [Theobroma cacao]
MGLLDQLWDDTVAGPRPDNGLGKLRKHSTFTFRPSSAKESDGGSVRSYGDETSEEPTRVTRSIMIVKPPGYQNGSPPISPAGSTPPVSPFSVVLKFNKLLTWMMLFRRQRIVPISEKVHIGRIREGQRGWTKEPSSSLRRVRYEPSPPLIRRQSNASIHVCSFKDDDGFLMLDRVRMWLFAKGRT